MSPSHHFLASFANVSSASTLIPTDAIPTAAFQASACAAGWRALSVNSGVWFARPGVKGMPKCGWLRGVSGVVSTSSRRDLWEEPSGNQEAVTKGQVCT
jgi:hypothetical protein